MPVLSNDQFGKLKISLFKTMSNSNRLWHLCIYRNLKFGHFPMVFEFPHMFSTPDNATESFSEYLSLLRFYFKCFDLYFFFQKASKGTKLQKLHHAALSGNEEEVQKLLAKGVGKRKL